MSKCKDCKYAQDSSYEIAGIECCTCSLTGRVMNAVVAWMEAPEPWKGDTNEPDKQTD